MCSAPDAWARRILTSGWSSSATACWASVVSEHAAARRFPHATEGELSVRLAGSCGARPAPRSRQDWDVGPHVAMLGARRGARQAGARRPPFSEDVCEALIGAVFLDAGFDAARARWCGAHWEARMRADAAPIQRRQDCRPGMGAGRAASPRRSIAKSNVQRTARICRISSCKSPLDGFDPERGEASSKRAAEQSAARAFLDRSADPMTACK